ncbi:hypothetical protein RFI_09903, partial [Reticulomyxa filosa]
ESSPMPANLDTTPLSASKKETTATKIKEDDEVKEAAYKAPLITKIEDDEVKGATYKDPFSTSKVPSTQHWNEGDLSAMAFPSNPQNSVLPNKITRRASVSDKEGLGKKKVEQRRFSYSQAQESQKHQLLQDNMVFPKIDVFPYETNKTFDTLENNEQIFTPKASQNAHSKVAVASMTPMLMDEGTDDHASARLMQSFSDELPVHKNQKRTDAIAATATVTDATASISVQVKKDETNLKSSSPRKTIGKICTVLWTIVRLFLFALVVVGLVVIAQFQWDRYFTELSDSNNSPRFVGDQLPECVESPLLYEGQPPESNGVRLCTDEELVVLLETKIHAAAQLMLSQKYGQYECGDETVRYKMEMTEIEDNVRDVLALSEAEKSRWKEAFEKFDAKVRENKISGVIQYDDNDKTCKSTKVVKPLGCILSQWSKGHSVEIFATSTLLVIVSGFIFWYQKRKVNKKTPQGVNYICPLFCLLFIYTYTRMYIIVIVIVIVIVCLKWTDSGVVH